MEGFIHDAYTLKALKQVRLGRSFFITGKAGTGKTTLLKEIVKECRARGKNIAVSAPTGVAAKNAELNNHNTAKKNGYFLGHPDNLITLSLSLSQALAYKRDNKPLILRAGRPRQYTAFLAEMQGRPHCFFVPPPGGGDRRRIYG